MVFLKALEVDNQQNYHKHISDRDGNTRQTEHDQLFLFSKEQEHKLVWPV